jgi:hypothetical protein
MYHILLTAEELELLKKLLCQKVEKDRGHETKTIESIIKKLEDPEFDEDSDRIIRIKEHMKKYDTKKEENHEITNTVIT